MSFILLSVSVLAFGQKCVTPTSLFTQDSLVNTNFAYVTLNYSATPFSEEYRVRFKEIGTTDWEFRYCYLDTSKTFGFAHNSTYVWNVRTFCDTTDYIISDWSVTDTFTTLEFTPSLYSPVLEITLGHMDCEKPAELTFTVEQDANEPDIQSSAIFSSAGSFEIYSLEEEDVIGEAYIMAGGGFYENDYTLTVDEVVNDDKAIVAMENEETGVTDGYFTIENESTGIKIVNVSPNDGNSYTSGNYSEITFYDLFMNPGPGVLEFYATIPSELSDLYDDQIDFIIGCVAIEEFLLPTIYPNPTDGVLNIDLEGTKNISLMNVTGQKVLELKTSSRQIDVSSLASGVYFLEVQTGIHLFRNKLILR
jgi:hypothetical protein